MQFSTAIVLAFVTIGANAIATQPRNSGLGNTPVYSPVLPVPFRNPPNITSIIDNQLCSTSSTSYCCTGGGFLSLTCVPGASLGSACNHQSICCENDGNGKQSCTSNDGNTVYVPVNVPINLSIEDILGNVHL